MVTTVEERKEIEEVIVRAQAVLAPEKVWTAPHQPSRPAPAIKVEEEESAAPAEAVALEPVPIQPDGMVVGIGRRVGLLHSWLFGTITDRDRIKSAVIKGQHDRWLLG